MENGKLILDACCGSRMFWFDKKNPLALFADIRDEEYILCDGRNLKVHPDIVSDFTDMPFLDKSFKLVVFDPPHLLKVGKATGFMEYTCWAEENARSLNKKLSQYQNNEK